MSVNVYANSAFDHANSAFASANNINGVDLTQNTNITSASSYANSGFTVANSASSYANASFTIANSAFTTGTAASSYANSGFTTANSAGVYANSAFLRANTPSHVANSASSYANGAFTSANVSSNLALSFGATTILEVTNNGSSAYRFSQYGVLDNPNVSTFSATTLGFKLNVTGHPFQIRLGDNTANFDTGLVHVSSTGTLLYGSAAQGQVDGTLFWRIPHNSVGNYKYRCSIHTAAMLGEINVANTAAVYFAYSS